MLFNQWEILKSKEKKNLSIVGNCPPSYINLTIQHLRCTFLCLLYKDKQVTDTKIYTGYSQWCKWSKREKKNGSDLHNPFSALVRSTSLAACQRQPWVRLQSVWTVLTANPFTYKTVRIHAANPPILLFFCLPSLQAPFHPMLCKLPDIHSTHRDVTAPWGWKILYLLSVSCTFMSVVIDLFCSLSIVRKPLGYCCMIGSWGRIGNMWPI